MIIQVKRTAQLQCIQNTKLTFGASMSQNLIGLNIKFMIAAR